MSQAQVRKIRTRAWLAILLATVGGFVDGVGFLVLFGLFTSHQSGNSILVGVNLGSSDFSEAIRHGFPIPMFVLGLMLGTFLNHELTRFHARSKYAGLLGVEAFLLLLFAGLGSLAIEDGILRSNNAWVFYPLAALPAMAMGLQNTTLHRVAGLPVRTTFVSGMLCALAEEATDYLWWLRQRFGRHRLGLLLRVSWRQRDFNRSVLILSIWCGFVLGAVSGAWAKLRWDLLALAAPIVGLIGVVIVDLFCPLAPPTPQAARGSTR